MDSRSPVRRLREWWRDYQWPAVAAITGVAFLLTWVGLLADPSLRSSDGSLVLDTLYRALYVFGIGRPGMSRPMLPWELQVARWILIFVAVYAVLKTWAAIFRQQLQLLRLRAHTGHTIVCGAGEKGVIIATGLRDRGEDVLVIDADGTSAGLAECAARGCATLVGDARDSERLRRARIDRAARVIALCGEDGTNAEIAVRARALAKGRRFGPLVCILHIGDLDLYHLVREREFPADASGLVRLQYFNVFESGARSLVNDRAFPAHLVIIGIGRFGESLLIQAARAWHAAGGGQSRRLRVTLVDRMATGKARALASRFPALRDTTDIRPWDADVQAPDFQRAEFLDDVPADSAGPSVYVCLGSEPLALSVALALRPRLRERGLRAVVRVSRDAGLAALVREDDDALAFFGLLPRACHPDLVIRGTNEVLARLVHEEYVRHQIGSGHVADGDPSMRPWTELADVLKESNRAQAHHIGIKLRAIGYAIAPLVDWAAAPVTFTSEEIDTMARLEHDRWVAERSAAGWHPGPERNLERRETADLVPWEQLTEDVRTLDRNTVRAIPAFLARAGLRPVRAVAAAKPAGV